MFEAPEISIKKLLRSELAIGFLLLIIFVIILCAWAASAQIDSSKPAEGRIVVDTNRKSIQHLEGGIVKTIHVKDGTLVKKGMKLITLNNTQAQAQFDLVASQLYSLLAIEAQLRAEQLGSKNITFPELLLKQKNKPAILLMMNAHKKILVANNTTFNGQIDILKSRINQLKKEILSLQALVDSESKQLKLINQEIFELGKLAKKGLISKPRMLALKREKAKLAGDKGEHLGQISQAQQKIGETQAEIIAHKEKRLKKILEQLRKTQKDLSITQEKYKSALDIVERTIIRAPTDGAIVGLNKHTLGGVIKPGEVVLELVPTHDKLLIEAFIDPEDIDVVYPGLKAIVTLSSYKARSTPRIEGKVTQISADSFLNKQTNKHFYKAKIEISASDLKKYPNMKLYPGMPATIMIITDTKSPLGYVVTPISQSFSKAFREQ